MYLNSNSQESTPHNNVEYYQSTLATPARGVISQRSEAPNTWAHILSGSVRKNTSSNSKAKSTQNSPSDSFPKLGTQKVSNPAIRPVSVPAVKKSYAQVAETSVTAKRKIKKLLPAMKYLILVHSSRFNGAERALKIKNLTSFLQNPTIHNAEAVLLADDPKGNTFTLDIINPHRFLDKIITKCLQTTLQLPLAQLYKDLEHVEQAMIALMPAFEPFDKAVSEGKADRANLPDYICQLNNEWISLEIQAEEHIDKIAAIQITLAGKTVWGSKFFSEHFYSQVALCCLRAGITQNHASSVRRTLINEVKNAMFSLLIDQRFYPDASSEHYFSFLDPNYTGFDFVYGSVTFTGTFGAEAYFEALFLQDTDRIIKWFENTAPEDSATSTRHVLIELGQERVPPRHVSNQRVSDYLNRFKNDEFANNRKNYADAMRQIGLDCITTRFHLMYPEKFVPLELGPHARPNEYIKDHVNMEFNILYSLGCCHYCRTTAHTSYDCKRAG